MNFHHLIRFTRFTLPLVVSIYSCIFIFVLWCTYLLSLLSVHFLGLIIRLVGVGLSSLCMLPGRGCWFTRFWSRVWLRGIVDNFGGMGRIFYLFFSQCLLGYSIQTSRSLSILYYCPPFSLSLNVTMVLSKNFSLLLVIFKFDRHEDTSLFSHFTSPKVYITIKNTFS